MESRRKGDREDVGRGEEEGEERRVTHISR